MYRLLVDISKVTIEGGCSHLALVHYMFDFLLCSLMLVELICLFKKILCVEMLLEIEMKCRDGSRNFNMVGL